MPRPTLVLAAVALLTAALAGAMGAGGLASTGTKPALSVATFGGGLFLRYVGSAGPLRIDVAHEGDDGVPIVDRQVTFNAIAGQARSFVLQGLRAAPTYTITAYDASTNPVPTRGELVDDAGAALAEPALAYASLDASPSTATPIAQPVHPWNLAELHEPVVSARILALPGGGVVAGWATSNGTLEVATSYDAGRSFTSPLPVASIASTALDARNQSIAIPSPINTIHTALFAEDAPAWVWASDASGLVYLLYHAPASGAAPAPNRTAGPTVLTWRSFDASTGALSPAKAVAANLDYASLGTAGAMDRGGIEAAVQGPAVNGTLRNDSVALLRVGPGAVSAIASIPVASGTSVRYAIAGSGNATLVQQTGTSASVVREVMNGGGSFVQEAGPTIALPQGAVVGPGAAANDLAVAFPVSNATDGVSLLVVDSAGVGTLHAASGAASAVRAPGEATNITLVSAPGGTWLLWANGSSNASSAEASSAWAADLGPGFSLAQTYSFRTEAGLSAGEVADATVLSDGSPLVLTSDAVPGGRALRSVPLFEPVPGPGSLLTLDWDGSSAAVHAAFGSVEYGNYSTIPPSTASAGRPTAPGTTGTSGAAGGAGAGTDTLNVRNTGTQSILTYDGASYAPSVLAPGQFLLAERDSTVEPVTIFNPTSVTLESVQLAFDPPPGWGVAPIASVTLPPRSQTTLPVVFQADDTSTPLPQGPGDIGILARWSAAGADLPLFVPLGRIPYTVPAATTPPVGGPVLSPWWLGGIGVAAALAALSLFGAAQVGALAGPLGGLYSRISRSEVLTHEVRAAIHDYARGHPGVRFEELRKTLGISAGSLSYHLRTLERQGYIRRSLDWARPRYYVTGNGSIVPVTQSAARTIEGALAGLPPQPLAAIARRIGISRQLARYHLRRMEAEGSIVTVSTSRRLRYALASPQDRSGRAPLASSAGGEPGSAPAGAMRAERTVSSAVPGAAAGAGARPDGSRPGS